MNHKNNAFIQEHTVTVFVHHPMCSVDSVNGVLQAFGEHYRLKIFTRHLVQDDFFDDVDLVVFPGGDGEASAFRYLLKNNASLVKRYLQRGGKYLGICMGAYWADAHYFDILKTTRVVQYIRRPGADIKSSYGTVAPVTWRGHPEQMYFYDGSTYLGGHFDTVATYANGDPMAIVQGSVGLIGCHLESQANWYTKKYMQPHWHHHKHHHLLAQFVADFLLEKKQLRLFQ